MARALAADPPVLLMDEPFSAVDPIVRKGLQDELLRIQAELGKTIVFVTHDIDEAIKIGDMVAVLRDGRRYSPSSTPPDELLPQPADAFVEDFLGPTAVSGGCPSSPRRAELLHGPVVAVDTPGAIRARRARWPPARRVCWSRTPSGRPLGWANPAALTGERADRLGRS